MMSKNSDQDIIASISSAPSLSIVIPADPSFEMVAAGTALFLALNAKGKNAYIACPSLMIVDFNHLVGVNEIKTKLSGQNLIISFDYVKDAIEKVSYNVDDGKFNLVIQPKSGAISLSPDKVQFSQEGLGSNPIILIGTTSQEVISSITGEPNLNQKPIFSLIAGAGSTLTSETLALIRQVDSPVNKDIAGNLYQGLWRETIGFTRASSFDFETAAFLVKSGAVPGEFSASLKPQEVVEGKDWTKPKIFHSSVNST